jgi:hypothetical protein
MAHRFNTLAQLADRDRREVQGNAPRGRSPRRTR